MVKAVRTKSALQLVLRLRTPWNFYLHAALIHLHDIVLTPRFASFHAKCCIQWMSKPGPKVY